jgi:hypothetical protein
MWESWRKPDNKLHGIGMVDGQTIDPVGIEKAVFDTQNAEVPVFGWKSGSQAN